MHAVIVDIAICNISEFSVSLHEIRICAPKLRKVSHRCLEQEIGAPSAASAAHHARSTLSVVTKIGADESGITSR